MTEQTPRDLAAEVDELTKRLDTLISKTGTDCDICDGRGWNINVPSQSMYPCNWCNGKGKVNVSPVESRRDPDPVCAGCGHLKSNHTPCRAIIRVYHDGRSDETCDCREFAPAAEPQVLDPVLVTPGYEAREEITTMIWHKTRLGLEESRGLAIDILTAIRAYGRDGAR